MIKRRNYFLICLLIVALTLPTTTALHNKSIPDDTAKSILQTDWNEQQKMLASDGAVGDNFGRSISISGDTAVIGAHCDDDNGPDSGSAYVFIRSETTWVQQAKLIAPDGASNDYFGWSVAVDGNTAIIGATGDDDNGASSGSVYAFVRVGSIWSFQQKLVASDGAAGDSFGYSVSLSSDSATVGSPFDADMGSFTGSAYVFVRSGEIWTQQAKILPAGAAAGDYVGDSVFISGDTALIGAPYDSDQGPGSGSAYVFIRSGTLWSQQTKLLASDGQDWDNFGGSVSYSNETALIGAEGDNDNGYDSGSTFVFIRTGTTWTEQAKLLASDGEMYDFFGGTVAFSGDIALIGAAFEDDNGDSAGAAYVYARSGTTWIEQEKILASDGAASDWFGGSVCLEGFTALICAYGEDDNGADAGCAYVFIGETSNEPPIADFSWTPETPSPNEPVLFDASNSSDSDGTIILYEWDWESDGIYDESHTNQTATHDWSTGGQYLITLRLTDDDGASATHADSIIVQNRPPNPPTMTGPHCGKINTNYTFTFVGTNPEGDEYFYYIDWDDGTTSNWLGPFPSGQTITITHQWSEPGAYHIRLKAKDMMGGESDWSEIFTIYITSKLLLIGFIQSGDNLTDGCLLLNMSVALVIKMKPIDIQMLVSTKVVLLESEINGLLSSRFIAVVGYGLVLEEKQLSLEENQ